MMTERRQEQAFLVALLNIVLWAAWVWGSWKFQTLEWIGPSLFWSLPVVTAGVVWTLVLSSAHRKLPLPRLLRGAAAGLLAAALGIPLSVLTGMLLAFAAFGPMVFIALVMEAILLFAGLGAMYALCGAALGALEEPSWTP
jgi:hypothetical protein